MVPICIHLYLNTLKNAENGVDWSCILGNMYEYLLKVNSMCVHVQDQKNTKTSVTERYRPALYVLVSFLCHFLSFFSFFQIAVPLSVTDSGDGDNFRLTCLKFW